MKAIILFCLVATIFQNSCHKKEKIVPNNDINYDQREENAIKYVKSLKLKEPWNVDDLIEGYRISSKEAAKHHFIYVLVRTKDPKALKFLGDELIDNRNPYGRLNKKHNEYKEKISQRIYTMGLAMEKYIYGAKPWRDGGPIPHVYEWWEEYATKGQAVDKE